MTPKFYRWIFASVSILFFTSSIFAQRNTGEPPKGKGKLLAGILVTSIGSGVGGLVFVYSVLGGSFCRESDPCKRDTRIGAVSGIVLLGASLGVGIPLIVSGKRERKKWREWNDQNEDRARSSADIFTLGVVPVLVEKRSTPGLMLNSTYRF